MSVSIMNTSSENFEVKEKRSSNASLFLMNPVASGDNVATNYTSAHKLKEELPPLVPCCEGKELQINEDLVRSGLSAISVKHDGVIQSLSLSHACEKLQVAPGLFKHRNSFRCLHRPDLKRVPYLRRMSPDELETLFRGYADFHIRESSKADGKDENSRISLTSDENMRTRDVKNKQSVVNDGVTGKEQIGLDPLGLLHPIPETQSRIEDVPAGMRLHGAKARLYTSVLAGSTGGDQLESNSTNYEMDIGVCEDPLAEDEVPFHEKLQIILPPRCDDTANDYNPSSTSANNDI